MEEKENTTVLELKRTSAPTNWLDEIPEPVFGQETSPLPIIEQKAQKRKWGLLDVLLVLAAILLVATAIWTQPELGAYAIASAVLVMVIAMFKIVREAILSSR